MLTVLGAGLLASAIAPLRRLLTSRVQSALAMLAFFGGTFYGVVSPEPFTLSFTLTFPFFAWEDQFWNPRGASDLLWVLGLTACKLLLVATFILLSAEDLDVHTRILAERGITVDRGDKWQRASSVVWFHGILAIAASAGAFPARLFT